MKKKDKALHTTIQYFFNVVRTKVSLFFPGKMEKNGGESKLTHPSRSEAIPVANEIERLPVERKIESSLVLRDVRIFLLHFHYTISLTTFLLAKNEHGL